MINKTSARLVSIASGLILAAGGLFVAQSASAGTVPNQYYCNQATGWCWQVNGRHDPSVFNMCYIKKSGTAGKPQQIRTSQCNRWGNPVP